MIKTIFALVGATLFFVLFSLAVGHYMRDIDVVLVQPKKFISLKKHLVVQGLPPSKARKVTPYEIKLICTHLDYGRSEASVVQFWQYQTDFSKNDWNKVLVVAKERQCPVYL